MKSIRLIVCAVFIFTLTLAVSQNAYAVGTVFTNPEPLEQVDIRGNSRSVQIVDINQDGFDDVVSYDQSTDSGSKPAYISVRLSNGDGTFGETKTTDIGGQLLVHRSNLKSLQFADINKDGKTDAVALRKDYTTTDYLIEIYTGVGDGTFVLGPWQSIIVPGNSQVFAADVNNDGSEDLIVSYPATSTSPRVARVYFNDGSGNLTPQQSEIQLGANASYILEPRDFNNDSIVDLVVLGTKNIFLGDGTGGFTAVPGQSIVALTDTVASAVDDFTGDGLLDFVLYHTSSPNPVSVYPNLGNGVISTVPINSPSAYNAQQHTLLRTADINNDGNTDLLAVLRSSDQKSVELTKYIGDGVGNMTFYSQTTLTTDTSINSYVLGDLNEDNYPDLIFGTVGQVRIKPLLAWNISYDNVSPTVSSTLTPAPNTNGWNNSDTTIQWQAEDPAPSSGEPTQPADTLANIEGVHEYTSEQSCDFAGNCATGSVTVKIDKSDPAISYQLDNQPNTYGWHNQDVTVEFTCNDTISGIFFCTNPVTLTEGANQSAAGQAVDYADNTSSTMVSGINIDTTASIVSNPSLSNNLIWFLNRTTTITANASDNISDVQGGEYFIDSDPGLGNGTPMNYANNQLTITTDINGLAPGTHTIFIRSVDFAGNWGGTTSIQFTYLF